MAKSIFHSSKFIVYVSRRYAIVHSSVTIFILIVLIWLETKNIFLGCWDLVDNLLARIKCIDTERRGSLWKSHGRFSIVWLNWLEQIFVHGTILIRHSDCEIRSNLYRVVEACLWNINTGLVSKLLWRSVNRFLLNYTWLFMNL